MGGQGQAGRHCWPVRRIGRSPYTSAAPRRPRGGAGCGGQRAAGWCGKTPCTRARWRHGRRRLGCITRRSGGNAGKSPCTRPRPGGCRRHPGRAAQPRGAPALEEPATAHAPERRRVLRGGSCWLAERATAARRACHRATTRWVGGSVGAGGIPSPATLRVSPPGSSAPPGQARWQALEGHALVRSSRPKPASAGEVKAPLTRP